MKLSKSIIDTLPKSSVKQVRQRNKARKELRRAENIVGEIEDRFQSAMSWDNRRGDENDESGHVLRVDGSYQVVASQDEDRRVLDERRHNGSAHYVEQNFFSTTYSSATKTTHSKIREEGDRAVFSRRDSYCSHYPDENVTVVRDMSSGEAEYKIYDSWLFGKLAQSNII